MSSFLVQLIETLLIGIKMYLAMQRHIFALKPLIQLIGFLLLLTPLGRSQNRETEVRSYLVPAVLELKNQEEVPDYLIDEVDTISLSESIIQRLRDAGVDDAEADVQEKSVPYDLLKDTRLITFFKPMIATSLINNGFLNFTQAYSARVNSVDYRLSVINFLTGLFLGKKAGFEVPARHRNMLPKHAIVELTVDPGMEAPNKRKFEVSPSTWGSVGAVLKDSVKQRATLTYGDSLLMYARSYPGTPLSDKGKRSGTHTFFSKFLRKNPQPYIEAQIYGLITLEHVDHFMVHKDISAAELAELMKIGLPIYRYSLEWTNVGWKSTKLFELFSGDAAAVAKWKANHEVARYGFQHMAAQQDPKGCGQLGRTVKKRAQKQ